MPLGRLPFAAILMNARRVIPITVYGERAATNLADFIVPGTLLVILGCVGPILMHMNVATAMATAYVVPTSHGLVRLAHLLELFRDLRRKL